MKPILPTIVLALLLTACAETPDCTPEAGFETGLAGGEAAEACQEQRYEQAWRLGRELGNLRAERDALIEREDELDASERARLRVLERDIPELEALARLDDLMPPAELPDE